MAKLNPKNSITEQIIHLLVTEKCNRKCPYCCNAQYDLSEIEYATDEELRKAKKVFITGGEPFAYSNPCALAVELKRKYTNLQQVLVYTNALELYEYLSKSDLYAIDGLTISIKNQLDLEAFRMLKDNPQILKLVSNRVYNFTGMKLNVPEFDVQDRQWQVIFEPAPDSIFRRYQCESE